MLRKTEERQKKDARFSPASVLVMLAVALVAEWAVFAFFGVPGARRSADADEPVGVDSQTGRHLTAPAPDAPATFRAPQMPMGPSGGNAMGAAKTASNVVAPNTVVTQGMTFTNQLQWVRWMKDTQPEQYRNMVSNQAVWRAMQLQQDEDRLQSLGALDVSRFTPEEREVHEAYQSTIVRQAELRELLSWENLESLSDAERTALEREQGESWRMVNDCAVRERELLLREAAIQLGVKREAAEQLVQEMYDVFQFTGWTLPRVSQ